ncbi:hypothetical protein CKF54_06995 [Psittacicella hinzii]|uniref:UvrD-like helicase C-terminal domain-containing protein n=1 Tax=Psittacicella hinzii TaxID=2028575 RepID=A0A3A1Y1J3_9GAMM|nr:AAA family ATPase [Psittacicella hinzii]RIY31290.1 hypothetical protein CKF54_06995 [Psittacicella hinzii]
MDQIYTTLQAEKKPLNQVLYREARRAYLARKLEPSYYNALLTIIDLSGPHPQETLTHGYTIYPGQNDYDTLLANFLFALLKYEHIHDNTAISMDEFFARVTLWGKHHDLALLVGSYVEQVKEVKDFQQASEEITFFGDPEFPYQYPRSQLLGGEAIGQLPRDEERSELGSKIVLEFQVAQLQSNVSNYLANLFASLKSTNKVEETLYKKLLAAIAKKSLAKEYKKQPLLELFATKLTEHVWQQLLINYPYEVSNGKIDQEFLLAPLRSHLWQVNPQEFFLDLTEGLLEQNFIKSQQDTFVEFYYRNLRLHLALARVLIGQERLGGGVDDLVGDPVDLSVQEISEQEQTSDLVAKQVAKQEETPTGLWQDISAWQKFFTCQPYFCQVVNAAERLTLVKSKYKLAEEKQQASAEEKLQASAEENISASAEEKISASAEENLATGKEQKLSTNAEEKLSASKREQESGNDLSDLSLEAEAPKHLRFFVIQQPQGFISLSLPYVQETAVVKYLTRKGQTKLVYNFPDDQGNNLKDQLLVHLLNFLNRFGRQEGDFERALEAGEVPNNQDLSSVVALEQALSFLIGGPGTGKTTTAYRMIFLSLALKLFSRKTNQALTLYLLAPTGKAASHLGDSIRNRAQGLRKHWLDYVAGKDSFETRLISQLLTNLSNLLKLELDLVQKKFKLILDSLLGATDSTLHAALGINPIHVEGKYLGVHKLQADLIIVDEVGMINLQNFVTLLYSLDLPTQLILLGDKNQLPSIGEGNVLESVSYQLEQSVYAPSKDKLRAYSPQVNNAEVFAQVYQRPIATYWSKDQEASLVSKDNLSNFADLVHELTKSHRYKEDSIIASYAEYINRAEAGQEGYLPHSQFLQQELSDLEKTGGYFYSYQDIFVSWLEALVALAKDHKELKKLSLAGKASFFRKLLAKENSDEVVVKVRELFSQLSEQGLQAEDCANLSQESKIISDQLRKAFQVFKDGEFRLAGNYNDFSQSLILHRASKAFAPLLDLAGEYDKLYNQARDIRDKGVTSGQEALNGQDLINGQDAINREALGQDLRQDISQELRQNLRQDILAKAFAIIENVRFLCPGRENNLGVNVLNKLMFKENYFEADTFYPIVVTTNQADLKLSNGDLGLVVKEAGQTYVYFNQKDTSNNYKREPLSFINKYELAFFTTIHKSQGDEFDNTYIVLPLKLSDFAISRSMLYTAITRAKKNVYIFAPREYYLENNFSKNQRKSSILYSWDQYL